MNQVDYVVKINTALNIFVEEYKEHEVNQFYDEFDINGNAKNRLNAPVKRIMAYSNSGLNEKELDEANM